MNPYLKWSLVFFLLAALSLVAAGCAWPKKSTVSPQSIEYTVDKNVTLPDGTSVGTRIFAKLRGSDYDGTTPDFYGPGGMRLKLAPDGSVHIIEADPPQLKGQDREQIEQGLTDRLQLSELAKNARLVIIVGVVFLAGAGVLIYLRKPFAAGGVGLFGGAVISLGVAMQTNPEYVSYAPLAFAAVGIGWIVLLMVKTYKIGKQGNEERRAFKVTTDTIDLLKKEHPEVADDIDAVLLDKQISTDTRSVTRRVRNS